MNRSVETRLRKLEAADPSRARQLFIIEGETEAERQAQIDALIRSGEAKETDSFIVTGVPRAPGDGSGKSNQPLALGAPCPSLPGSLEANGAAVPSPRR